MVDTNLMSALTIDSVEFVPQFRQEFSRQAGGTPRVADIGPEIWTAKIGCSNMSNVAARAAAAIINQMRGSLGTFYVWDPRAQYPQSDLTGSILGSNTVTIYALGSDNKSLSLAGLPIGYVITAGDKLSFDHGTPNHRCLHEFVAGATADGSGNIALTEVVPHIREGASTGLTVTLKRPTAEMMIMPATYNFPSTGPVSSSITFTAIQVP